MSFGGLATSISTRARVVLQRSTEATVAARAARAAAKAKDRKEAASRGSLNPRYELMKNILFYREPRSLPALNSEDMERHLTILRAQSITKKAASDRRKAERNRKFAAMVSAYEALEKADPRLYEEACKQESNITFPRQMRVPTETPPIKIWDYLDNDK
ncbi:hypothetical protein H4R20_004052 [Coemansia guatemalensis]|uniref:Large ribosomal subunit protein mL40 n=1 Tax=Coemansia guatemalensis TaxID=2761395 RepID=A0A9W8LTH0_9FUNG|nr:hypothetical protein H4R20_004052 [Coemansia guatemalensis]